VLFEKSSMLPPPRLVVMHDLRDDGDAKSIWLTAA
jgi:hypothetical protein